MPRLELGSQGSLGASAESFYISYLGRMIEHRLAQFQYLSTDD